MRVGRLFEVALKHAQLSLKPGAEMMVKVHGRGQKIHLVVQPSGISKFEASILERSKKIVLENIKPYSPKMPAGERIRTLRITAGMTLNTVASKAGMTKGSLCSIEKGERAVGLAVLKKLSKALGVSISVLVE